MRHILASNFMVLGKKKKKRKKKKTRQKKLLSFHYELTKLDGTLFLSNPALVMDWKWFFKKSLPMEHSSFDINFGKQNSLSEQAFQ